MSKEDLERLGAFANDHGEQISLSHLRSQYLPGKAYSNPTKWRCPDHRHCRKCVQTDCASSSDVFERRDGSGAKEQRKW